MPRLSTIAAQQADRLKADGVDVTFAEVVWLNDLGLAVEEPLGEVSRALRGAPVRCGNVILHPFTIASHSWYFQIAAPHYVTDDGATLAMGYALAHGVTPSVFDALLTRRDIHGAVNRWKLRCSATIAELHRAINIVCPSLSVPHVIEQDKAFVSRGWGEVLAELVAGTGLDEAYWRAQPISTLAEHLYAIDRQAAAGLADLGATEEHLYRKNNLALLRAVEAIRLARRPPIDKPAEDQTPIEQAAQILRDAYGHG